MSQGLISSDRTAGNQRRYHGDVMCRLAMIEACQRVGLSLAEVGQARAALPPGQAPNRQDWDALAEQLRAVAQSRIDQLSQVLRELAPAPWARPAQVGCMTIVGASERSSDAPLIRPCPPPETLVRPTLEACFIVEVDFL